jgi:hypothetical protein
LGAEIQKIASGALELDRATDSYLQFTAKASGGGGPAKEKSPESAQEKGVFQKLFGK